MTDEIAKSAPRLLTEKEAAERLRTSIRKVQRLRRERMLAFIPGRPVLIMEQDIEDYLFRQRVAEAKKAIGPPTLDQSAAAEQAKFEADTARAREILRLRKIRMDLKNKR